MDAIDEQIKEALQRIAKSFAPDMIFEGVVTAIDPEQYLVDVELDSGGDLFECRLRATAGSTKSIDVLPAEGSAVILAKINEDEYLILACDEITEYRITVGQVVYKINDTGHLIEKGDETLKKILNDLVDQVLKIYAPKDVPGLTAIKLRINNLLQ